MIPALMVQGTSSSAGKTFLVTALCRLYARRGLRVAPFKAVNMSNNARVVPEGEISSAQWLQARAARVPPDVRMNPILVKPEAGGSYVVVNGRPDPALSALPWERRPPSQWPVIRRALDELRQQYELVVIEGAGSPAEINLAHLDVVNMRVAEEVDAPVLLVADIDRGGAFAHLYGTWALVGDAHRRRIKGFVLNKFRGDPDLLGDGPAALERLTGVPTLGAIPHVPERLPDEDAYGHALHSATGPFRVAVLRFPTASNLDELGLLEGVAAVNHVVASQPLTGYDLVILPGSKDVPADLDWLRGTGLAGAVTTAAAAGTAILAVCGGFQMLGRRIIGPGASVQEGLGLLPVDVRYAATKLVSSPRVRLGDLTGAWAALAGASFAGYEIRHGRMLIDSPVASGTDAAQAGSVLGIACHGLLEAPEVVRRLTGTDPGPSLDETIDLVADAVEASLPVEAILSW